MNITCKHCGAKYQINQDKINNQAFFSFNCFKCQKINNDIKNTQFKPELDIDAHPLKVSPEDSHSVDTSNVSLSEDGERFEIVCPHCLTRYKLEDKHKKFSLFICVKCENEFSFEVPDNSEQMVPMDDFSIKDETGEIELDEGSDDFEKDDNVENEKLLSEITLDTERDDKELKNENEMEIDLEVSDEPVETEKSDDPEEPDETINKNTRSASQIFNESEIRFSSVEPSNSEENPETIVSEVTNQEAKLPEDVANEIQASSDSIPTEESSYLSATNINENESENDVKIVKASEIAQDSYTDIEKLYKESIRFDESQDAISKNYVVGSVPTERKNRFFLNPAPVSEKFYFNKIKDKIRKDPALIGRKMGEDEFDNPQNNPIQNSKKRQSSQKNTRGLLVEFDKTMILDKNSMSVKRERKMRFYILVMLILILLSLIVYNYLLI